MIGTGRLSAGILALVLAGLSPVTGAAQSLGDTLSTAYRNSGVIEQNRALLRAADEDVAVAVAAVRPVLNWSASVTRDFSSAVTGGSFGREVDTVRTAAGIALTSELTLYDFGRNRLAIDAAKETVLSARESLVSVEQDVLLRAVAAHMNVRREMENVALRENNLRLIREELRAARDRFEVGEVTRTDVALAEARLASSRSALAAARGNLRQAQAEYLNAVGAEPGPLVPPARVPNTAASLEAAKRIALREHPQIRAAQREAAVADINVARAEAAQKPTVSLTGRLQTSGTFASDNYSKGGQIGLEASGPIYQGGRLTALVRQAIARRDAARSNLHVVRLQVEQRVTDAFVSLQVAQAALASSDEQIRAARVAFNGIREEASLGARTTLDVLNAEQELLDARAVRISAVADQYIAAYSLLSAMGLMTANYLNLNVPIYDPSEYYNLVKDAPLPSQQGEQLDRVLRALGKE